MGIPLRMYVYGYVLKHEEGITRDIEEGIKYYKMASDTGIIKAKYNYAIFHDSDPKDGQKKKGIPSCRLTSKYQGYILYRSDSKRRGNAY